MTPNLCLETSFTSLQSPGEPYPLISCSSKASSMAGSLFSRSQLNSILHPDGMSQYDENLFARSTPAASEATTVILSDQPYRGKSVAFDINTSSYPSASTPSPNFLLKSILHRQNGNAMAINDILQSHSQSQSIRSLHKIDIAKDDWFGRAPLASPETLSEISSISSRTSIAFNLATSIENYLHRIASPDIGGTFQTTADNSLIEHDVSESQLHTPKVMRRAPKITGNLSKCADDWQLVDKYKRMGKVFITNPVPLLSSSDSSGASFESTHSLTKTKCCTTNANSRSFDTIDNDCDTTIKIAKLTLSDSAILDGCLSKCPRCPCKRSNSSFRLECCRKNDHSWCIDSDDQQNTSSTSDTYHSAQSSLATIEPIHMNSSNAIRLPSGVLESHFPVYTDNNIANESTSLLPSSSSSSATKNKSPKLFRRTNKQIESNGNKNNAGFRRISRDYERDRCFSRNDSLPLLANLVERNSSPNSFNRRRNHTVYPITSSPNKSNSSTNRTESNV